MSGTTSKRDAGRKCLKTFKHPRIAIDGFLYQFHKKCKRHLRFKCNRAFSIKCPSVLRTTLDLDDLKIVGVDHDHIHGDDTNTIQLVQNRLAAKIEKFRGDPTKLSTMIMFNNSGVFEHTNGKLLHVNINKSTSKRTMYKYNGNTNKKANGNLNTEELKHLNSQDNSINITSENKTEMDCVIVEQNMHRSTNIEMHSPIHQEIEYENLGVKNRIVKNKYFKEDSNQVVEISDDDDCDDTQFDTVTSSIKNLNSMKNPMVDIETEMDCVIVEQNMHHSTNIEMHSPIHQEIEHESLGLKNRIIKNKYFKEDSNQVVEISDDDDCDDTQFDTVTSSIKNLNSMKNPMVDIETEKDCVIVEQNMHHSTNIEMHSPIHQEIEHESLGLKKRIIKNKYFKEDSNQVVEISDDDDCDDTQFDTVTKSIKKLNSMKNSMDDYQTQVMYPYKKNLPASMELTPSEKLVTSQSTESVLEIQQTPYTSQLSTKNVNSNKSIPQRSNTSPKSCLKDETEVARIHSSTGVVTISIVNGPDPASTSSVSSGRQPIVNHCLNNSSTTVTPKLIDPANNDRKVDVVGINNILSTSSPVPETIPISENVQNMSQQVPETNELVLTNTIPIPKIEPKVSSTWFSKTNKNDINAKLILSFDNYDKVNKPVKSLILCGYQKKKNEPLKALPNWRIVGELIPINFPAECGLRLDSLGEKDYYFSAAAKDLLGQIGEFSEPVLIELK